MDVVQYEDEARQLGLTSANWLDGPYNRLGFRHVAELTRTAKISRGAGPVFALPRAERDLEGFEFEHEGRSLDLPTMLEETYTDGFLVIHDGSVLCEHYFNGMAASETHLLMSVSKSMNAALCGVLGGHAVVRPEDLVTDHVEQLRGSAWEGCTVQHLLDMRVGIDWDFDLDEYTILDVSDYRAHSRTDIPADTATWARTVGLAHEHGGSFGYCSLATDVLGWVLACAGGAPLPELLSAHLWSAIGAEHDAEIMVDSKGFPIIEGGICATLRDVGRFGLMWLSDGSLDGRSIVPKEWVARLRVRDQELIDAYGEPSPLGGPTAEPFYHDNWWVWDTERGVHAAVGMNGQSIFVHRPSRTVVAKLSTFPDALDADRFALQHVGMSALCESLI
ncbi:MAG: serine hydrolase domain-containing protein [Solirubrobacteraceae bacterium]